MNALQKKLLLSLAALLSLQSIVNTIKYFFDIGQSGRFGGDFIVFWHTAQLLVQGHYHDIYDTLQLKAILDPEVATLDTIGPFIYPPTMLFLLWPLGNLSYNQAVALWSLIPLTGFFAMLYLLMKRSAIKGDGMAYALVFAFMTPFLTANLFTGQTSTIIATLFLFVFWFWNTKPLLAGIGIGLITLKPQLGLLLPVALIASRQWRMMAAATMTVVVLATAATTVLGVSIWSDYLNMTKLFGQYLKEGVGQFDKLALGPYISLHALEVIGVSNLMAGVAQMLLSLAFAAMTFRIYCRNDGPHDIKFAILACGSLLSTPYSMCYDSPVLTAAVLPLLVRFWSKGFDNLPEVLALAAVLALPFAQPLLLPWHIPFAFLATLVLWVVLYRRYKYEV